MLARLLQASVGALFLGAATAALAQALGAATQTPPVSCSTLASESEEFKTCEQARLQRRAAYEKNMVKMKPYVDRAIKVCIDADDWSDCAIEQSKRLPKGFTDEEIETFRISTHLGSINAWGKRNDARKAAILERCKKAGIREGIARIGMSSDMVKVCGWGNPETVNRTITAGGTTEQWVYGDGRYLYFTNSRLTAIQD